MICSGLTRHFIGFPRLRRRDDVSSLMTSPWTSARPSESNRSSQLCGCARGHIGEIQAADIFVVGLPRSGTTLLEHILTGLAGVRSNGETNNFARALMAAAPSGSGDLFDRAAAANPDVVAANYERLASLSSAGERVIEKLPINYLYLGAIRRALPGSKDNFGQAGASRQLLRHVPYALRRRVPLQLRF